ncbi:hypothetical protein ACP4OV_008614 [Aristida adscensionis]
MAAAEEQPASGAHLAGDEAPAAPKMVTMVELPPEYLRWVVAQRKEDYRVPTLADYPPEQVAEGEATILRAIAALQAAYDEFDALRAWAGDVLEAHGGRVVVPEGKLHPNARAVQRIVHKEWAAGASRELAGMAATAACGGSGSNAGEEEEGDDETTTVPRLGPHLFTLSTYLSLIYGYVSKVVGLY